MAALVSPDSVSKAMVMSCEVVSNRRLSGPTITFFRASRQPLPPSATTSGLKGQVRRHDIDVEDDGDNAPAEPIAVSEGHLLASISVISV